MIHKFLQLIFVATLCMIVFLAGALTGTFISAIVYPIVVEEVR